MKKLSLVLVFIVFVFSDAISQNPEKGKFIRIITNDGNIQSPVSGNSEFDDLKNLNGNFLSGTKSSDVFNINSLDNTKFEFAKALEDIIQIQSEDRELPLALYIKKDVLNSETDEPVSDRVYKILGNKDLKEKMKIVNEKEFHIVSIVTDELGITHVKLNQYFRNRLVFGGQIYLHLNNNIEYNFINGRWFKDPSFGLKQRNEEQKNDDLKYEFRISANQIEKIIKENLSDSRIHVKELSGLERSIINGEQIGIEEAYFPDEITGEFKPVYVASVSANSLHKYKYIVDAQEGDIIRKQTEHCSLIPENRLLSPLGGTKANAKDLHGTTREINVYEKSGLYYMLDISRPMFNNAASSLPDDPQGVIITLNANNTSPNSSSFQNKLDHVKSSNNTWNATAVSAHFNAGFAYEYYINKFARNSIDGKGGNVMSIINVTEDNGTGMDNAFWAGTAMFYGNGNKVFTSPLPKSLDVAGHELTHGVIQNTANLEYYDEPGAINESFADVFGVMMDRDDWKLGEDVVSSQYFPTGALRDMSNPHNGGSGTNGYQPAHFNEKYTGEDDNRGVHINSGIANFAFQKFAVAVGKEKAEQVYYRALIHYLTKSSDFKDLRVAIENSANDLYGTDTKNAASAAFAAVGIGGSGGTGSNNQQDLKTNPGSDYIICTDEDYSALYLLDGTGKILKNPLSGTDIQSKPSITDDGKHVVFVGIDNKIHYIYLEWPSGTPAEQIIQESPVWRSAVISKDGSKIAALKTEQEKKIHVYSYDISQWEEFELYNPSTAEGVDLGTVLYADVLEFDYSGEWIMYDCKNSLSSGGFFDIDYWDIGFINVWNNKANKFEQGRVEKLFSGLPDEVSIGNPTFSKNSPYIIAFDYRDATDFIVYGANIETGDLGIIFSNNDWSSPSFSRDDKKVIFDYNDGSANVGIVDLDNTKINQVVNTGKYFIEGGKWGVWFSNGVRKLTTSTAEIPEEIAAETFVYPNPVLNTVNFDSRDFDGDVNVSVFDILGNKVLSTVLNFKKGKAGMDISNATNGNYIVKANDGKQVFTSKIMIIRK
ncbi:MAG: M4 family metallopeptidase [Saprospiraceae bacterium]|nr:M4 family metallopeptidase [Saprospiraceae bacterium]